MKISANIYTIKLCALNIHILNFQILGSLIAGSGFEDTVYQSGLCTSGSLNGVIAGSHYNRAWSLHSAFSEALERLLMARFINEKRPYISTKLTDYSVGVNSPAEDVVVQSSEFLDLYSEFRSSVAKGAIGKTAQYWMLYLDLMRAQSLGLAAAHQNDLELLICAWKTFLPFYFAMNKVNYARYETILHIQYKKLKNFFKTLFSDFNEFLDANIDLQWNKVINF